MSRKRWQIFAMMTPALLCLSCASPQSAALPDLTVAVLTVPAAVLATAETWTLTATVSNSGGQQAGVSTLEYRLSYDTIVDASDLLIQSSAIPAVPPGASHTDTTAAYSLQDFGTTGTHYVIAIANADSGIQETDTTNNTKQSLLSASYNRVIVDTYKPDDWVGPSDISPSMYMNLFGENGDSLSYTPNVWDDTTYPDQQLLGSSLAYDSNGSNPNKNPADPNYYQSGYSYIEYVTSTELAPGSILWVRVRGSSASDAFPYAVRVLTAPLVDDYTGWWFGLPYNTADTSDLPISGSLPTTYQIITPGGKLNRYIHTSGEIGWVKITLP